MNSTAEKFLVVINPYEPRHMALQRAIVTAGIRDHKPTLHLYINPHSDGMDPGLKPLQATFGNLALKELTNYIEAHALPYDYEFSWAQDVEKAVVDSAQLEEASLIIYPLNDEVYNRHKGLTQGTWALLRNSSCPVMLVAPDSAMQRKVILAAVNFQSPFPEYTELNKRILARAKWIAERYGARLYVVNAYTGSEDYPDYEEIRKACGLPFEQIRIEEGKPEKAVSAVARDINADLVMIGTRNTHDSLGLFRRNTAEKVLMALNRDMIVVN
jgi:universal stress protein E